MKKVKHHYLDADHRPLFGGYNSVIDTKIQKQNSRQALKNQLQDELNEYLEEEEYDETEY